LHWTYDGTHIDVTWSDAQGRFAPGEERRLRFAYTIRNPVSGLYFSVPDAAYPERSLHSVTDHETERARFWLPTVDFPAVRTTLRFEV
jgi:aminopeptidase N